LWFYRWTFDNGVFGGVMIHPTVQNYADEACVSAVAFSQGDLDKAKAALRRMNEMIRTSSYLQSLKVTPTDSPTCEHRE
jgi:hypothetical protein